jgi:hypothetical protein
VEYVIQPRTWTMVGDTGVEVRYDADSAQTVRTDDQGAIILPPFDPVAEALAPWTVRPGNVPVTRDGQDFDLDHPETWPAGYTLVDGKWLSAIRIPKRVEAPTEKE